MSSRLLKKKTGPRQKRVRLRAAAYFIHRRRESETAGRSVSNWCHPPTIESVTKIGIPSPFVTYSSRAADATSWLLSSTCCNAVCRPGGPPLARPRPEPSRDAECRRPGPGRWSRSSIMGSERPVTVCLRAVVEAGCADRAYLAQCADRAKPWLLIAALFLASHFPSFTPNDSRHATISTCARSL